jgi:hypothetical protein
MLLKEVISEFGDKTFDICEQKISLFPDESLQGVPKIIPKKSQQSFLPEKM